MARRGRFGRLPRVSPGLSQTLANIAREMQNQRAQNLMDAWQKGGSFEGKKATDDVVLAFWRDRLTHVDKNDPLYDTYKNAVLQTTYSIEESKMTAAYATNKRTDGQMVAFYMRWARKVPKNSELWRQLQRNAGQYMRDAKARSTQSAAQAKENAYQHAQARTRERYTAAGEYLFEVLRKTAEGGALIGVDGNLADFDVSDPAKMLNLLSSFNGTTVDLGPFVPSGRERSSRLTSERVLFTDLATGRGVTGADVRAQMRRLDPSFDGQFSPAYVASVLDDAHRGATIMSRRANKTGHTTDANSWSKWDGSVLELTRQTNIWPIAKSYEESYARLASVYASPDSTPEDIVNATEEFRAGLPTLAKNADANTAARLIAEANGDSSAPSLHEDVFGFGQAQPANNDIAKTEAIYQDAVAQVEAVASGAAVWTSGVMKDGRFTPSPGGMLIGAATPDQLPAGSVAMFLPHGGKTMLVVAQPQPITTRATDADGFSVPTDVAKPLGQYFEVSLGGNKTQVYQMTGADGRPVYTVDPPFGPGTRVSHTASGVIVDVSGLVPRYNEATKTWVDPRTGQPLPPGGANGWSVKVTQSGPNAGAQTLQYNPADVVISSEPSRQAAGYDKRTDFISPALAALATLPEVEANATWNSMKNDPVFQAQLQQDILAGTAGPGGAVDPVAAARVSRELGLYGWKTDTNAALNRTSTAPTFETPSTKGVLPTGGYRNIDARGLPLEQLRRLPSDNMFSPLASAVREGTNIPATVAQQRRLVSSVGTSPTIKTNIDLRVPGVPPSTYRPPPPPPATTARPAQQQSQQQSQSAAPPPISSSPAPLPKPPVSPVNTDPRYL